MVNVISVCRSIVPSADSPAPPFEQGMKALNGIVCLS
jgi:hypothetical protein